MADKHTPNPKVESVTEGADNRVKDPEDWVTGEDPMTGAQASYLKTLTEAAGEEFDPELTKAQASERIDALQAKTGKHTQGHGNAKREG